jgi:hypothetical protein
MVNQHPGPLDPSRADTGGKGMYGKRVPHTWLSFKRQIVEQGALSPFLTEATAQLVSAEYDMGAVICRRSMPVLPSDDPITLSERLKGVEYGVQIEALRLLAHDIAKPLTRDEPLVAREHIGLLEQCKQEAIRVWPRG